MNLAVFSVAVNWCVFIAVVEVVNVPNTAIVAPSARVHAHTHTHRERERERERSKEKGFAMCYSKRREELFCHFFFLADVAVGRLPTPLG